jgi:uncharacterized LabA/DUF88 family protein
MKRPVSTKKGTRERPERAEKVIVYIDGFNLYFGPKSRRWARFLWLDLNKMAQSLLKSNQTLVRVKYFTSRIRLPHDKAARQNTFLEALETLPNLDIFYGNYQINKRTCRNCGSIDRVKNEKMTDVNIATEMLTDAFLGKFDTALLISGDGDLTTPVKRIADTAGKRVVLVYPPDRRSFALESVATAHIFLGRQHLVDSQFPLHVRKANGFILNRPAVWPI